MNTDELMSLLTIRTVNLEPRGGIGAPPALTSYDIDGALAMCEDQFAARIYHATVAAEYDRGEIEAVVARAMFEEWRARVDRLTMAQLSLATAAMVSDPIDRQFLQRRARMHEACARAALWPRSLLDRPYSAIRRAVISELRKNLTCPQCQGFGFRMEGRHREDCTNCAGAGRLVVTDRQRAIAIDVLPSTYIRTWRAVYEWLFWMLVDAVTTGRAQLHRALGN